MTGQDRHLATDATEPLGPCVACGERHPRLLISQRAGKHLHIDTVYDIHQCCDCGLAFVANPPSADILSQVYDKHFFSTSQQIAPVDDAGRWTPAALRSPIYRNARRRLRDIRRFKPSGSLLDIGCGKGYFLKVASEHFTVTGNDLSAHAVEYGRTALGLEMIQGDFIRVAMRTESFDVVTMWDALASLSDPSAAVARVSELLRPGGLFAFTIPDIASLAFRLTRRFWPLLIPPINLFYFTRPSVQLLLAKHGLIEVGYRHDGKSVGTNFVLRKLGRILGISALDRDGVRIPGVSSLYLNLGDIATVYARKA